MEHKTISIDLLDGHKQNYRSHPPVQIAKLKASLERFKQVRSIVVALEKTGRYTILAGHGVVEASVGCGITEINCDIVPDTWSQDERNAYLIADNMHSQDAEDDQSMLAHLLQEQQDAGYDLASLGTDDETLRQMVESLGDERLSGDDGEEEGDEEQEPDEKQTRVQAGDIWKLGTHTIACLSSIEQETYKKLLKDIDITFVWSDPPYGISCVNKNGHIGLHDMSRPRRVFRGEIKAEAPVYAPVIGDDSKDTAHASFQICNSLYPKALHIWWGANHYSDGLPSSSCWLVWDKVNDLTNFADAELAWCSSKGAVRIFRHTWNGIRKDSEQGVRRVHPNQKPCALASWAFERFGNAGDIIFDPFLGSGISVIAAEKMGDRTVIGCELSPEYINIILSRWEKLTKKEATLLERVEVASHA